MKVGRENFDTRRYVYFQDDNAAWQAFTKGGFEDIRPENRSQRWATDYNFPAFKAGDVIKARIRQRLRRTDAGLRAQYAPAAIPGPPRAPGADLCLRFREHEPHAVLWVSTRARTAISKGGELASSGLPTGKELEILSAVQGQAAAGIVHQGVQAAGLRYAAGDARESAHGLRSVQARPAGSTRAASCVNDEDRRAVQDRVPRRRPDRRAHHQRRSSNNLRKLGIDASLRIVDTSQYVNRYRNFDFDFVTAVLAQSQSPGNEQRDFWSSQGGRHAGLAQLCGHQGSGRRRAGRPRHLRHRPRRPAGRHPCARPRAVVELLRRAAMAPAEGLDRLLEQVRHSREAAELYRRRHRIPGGSTRPRRPRCKPSTRARIEHEAGDDPSRPAGARRRGRRLAAASPAGPSRRCPPTRRCTGCRPSAISNMGRTSRISTM